MATTSLKIGYRPLRVGFCINENNISDVISSVELNTVLWGGIYNPIIPIGTNNDLANRLVDIFQPDILYPIGTSKEVASFIENNKQLHPDIFRKEVFQQDDKGLKPTLLDVSNIISYHWDKVFKISKRSNCMLPSWNKKDPLKAVFEVEFGIYPDNPSILFNYTEGYKKGLRAKTVSIEPKKVIPSTLNGKMTPISLTSDRLELINYNLYWSTPGVYVGDESVVIDLINFWNLRAAGIDLHFVPIKNGNRTLSYIKPWVKSLQKRTVVNKFQMGIGVWYKSDLKEEVVKQVTSPLFADNEPRSHYRVDKYTWSGTSVKPSHPTFETKTVLANLDWNKDKPSLSVQLPEKPIIEENRYNSFQRLVCSFDPFSEYGYKNYTLKLPFLPKLNMWYGRNVLFNPEEFRIGRGEFGKIINLYENTARLDPLQYGDIIEQTFLLYGITAKNSQSGLITKRIIEQMDGIDGCRVFKITGVRKLIYTLGAKDWLPFGEVMRAIADVDPVTKIPSFNNHVGLYIEPRDERELTKEAVINHLLNENIFRIGMAAKCPNCKLDFWLSLKDINEQVQCEYCGYSFKISTQLRKNIWQYRRSGLFGKNNNQEGAIPVILTLMRLLRPVDVGDLIYSTALNLKSATKSIDCETDLVVFNHDNQNSSVSILIGECKTDDPITDDDIANLLEVKKAIDDDKIKVYILFSKVSEFTHDEIERFKRMDANGVCPILFSKHDIEPYEPDEYYRINNIKLPMQYAHDFESLSVNSKSIYLK